VKSTIKSIGKRARRLVHYGLLLARMQGFGLFWIQLKRQIYSRFTQVGFALDLQKTGVPIIEAGIKYTLKMASQEDMDELLEQAKAETDKMAHKLIFRKMLYEDGYRNCYIARTTDTNEICSLTFTIYSWDNQEAGGSFRDWFPGMKADEALLEGVYTFEKYRGNKLHLSVLTRQIQDCKEKGINTIKVYIEKNNRIPMKVVEKVGFRPVEEVHGTRFIFRTRTRFSPIRKN